MRLPSIPQLRFGWRLVSLVMICVLLSILYTLWFSPAYQVTAVEVRGLRNITNRDINVIANVAGKQIFTVDPVKVEQDIQNAFFDLSSVSVEVTIPATVTVVIEERQPIFVWHQEGRMLWIDTSGVAFPPRSEGGPSIKVEAEDFPTSSSASEDVELEPGEIPARFLPPQLITAILAVSVHAPEDTTLMYTKKHGLGWKDVRGWEVYFGTSSKDIEMKLGVYEATLHHLLEEGIQPVLISVEYVHAPYYRLEW
jgi:cell division protein FtsQ